jgi:putative FmdB family regulatory protein
MPTYEYKCHHCGQKLEKFQSMTAKPIRKCPKCGHNTLHRLIGTGAGIIFKGSGFYETDYRPQSYKDAAKADSGGSNSGGAETKSDSKPESKSGDSAKAKSDAKAKSESKSSETAVPKSEGKAKASKRAEK